MPMFYCIAGVAQWEYTRTREIEADTPEAALEEMQRRHDAGELEYRDLGDTVDSEISVALEYGGDPVLVGPTYPGDEAAALDPLAALAAILPYARSRCEDMHEWADETHGEGKAFRCACYRKVAAAVADAMEALGQDTTAERKWCADMDRAAASDPGQPVGSCGVDICKCAGG